MSDQVTPTSPLTMAPPPPPPVAPKAAAAPAKAPPGSPAEAPPAAPTQASLEAAAGDVKAFISKSNSDLEFQVDKSSGRFYFRVVDPKTKEVILQVPSEETLAMARKLRELSSSKGAAGVLVDKQG